MFKSSRRRSDFVSLSPAEAARQGRAAKLAWEHMPRPGTAVEFLNSHHAGLGGRPIDLAVSSEAGLSAVEGVIAALSERSCQASGGSNGLAQFSMPDVYVEIGELRSPA